MISTDPSHVLQVNGLRKTFGGVIAVDGCSFTVTPQTITALIGPNGAGKTTVFNLVAGLIAPDAGEIRLNGKPIGHLPAYQRARTGIARTFQSVRLFGNLTVRENCLLAATASDERVLRGWGNPSQRLERHERVRAALHVVGFNQPLEVRAADLSYGQGKLLELARALLLPHRLLMLDEPVAGVTPPLRESLKGVLQNLRQRGETVLLIEHDMQFVFDVADAIIVMAAGKVLKTGRPEEIRRDPEVLEAYLGEQL